MPCGRNRQDDGLRYRTVRQLALSRAALGLRRRRGGGTFRSPHFLGRSNDARAPFRAEMALLALRHWSSGHSRSGHNCCGHGRCGLAPSTHKVFRCVEELLRFSHQRSGRLKHGGRSSVLNGSHRFQNTSTSGFAVCRGQCIAKQGGLLWRAWDRFPTVFEPGIATR